MTELERQHAADARAVGVVAQIAAADAVNDAHRLGLRDAVAEHDPPAGRAGGVAHPLELEAGEHVGQPAVSVLGNPATIKKIPPRGEDDVAHVDLEDFVLLVEVDGAGGAHLLADAAFAPLEPDARPVVDHGDLRNGLREGRVDRLAVSHPRFEDVIDHFPGALLDAQAAPVAGRLLDVAGFPANASAEVPDRARDLLELGVRQQCDVVVLACFRHLRRQDTGGAIERRKGLVVLRHVAADTRLALDEVDGVAGIRQLQRRLDASDAASDHQRVLVDRHGRRFERLLALHAGDRPGHKRHGLPGRGLLVPRHPGDVLADVGHLEQKRIQPRGGTRAAERLFVQVRRARRHDHAGQAVLLHVVADHRLPQRGAEELVIARHDHAGQTLAGPAGHPLHVDRCGDVASAMADVDAHAFLRLRFRLVSHSPGLLSVQTGALLRRRSRPPRRPGTAPRARPPRPARSDP